MKMYRGLFLSAFLVTLAASVALGDEPPLPLGLEPETTQSASDEPALPTGLDAEDNTPPLPEGLDFETGDNDAGPALPEGLGDTEESTPPAETKPAQTNYLDAIHEMGFSGFWEVRGGMRTQHDRYEKQASIGETRFQLEWKKKIKGVTFKFTGDLLYDQVDNRLSDINLIKGTGWFDLREAWASFTPVSFMDVKVGRQILTWGTGDLLFLNDVFPKDWVSFFNGRDLEYLKAPSDAIKMSFFSEPANWDVVYMPRFEPSRGITGRRFSYWNPQLGRLAGRDAIVDPYLPDDLFKDAEYATRVWRKLGSYELAGYGYWGYWKTPEGFNPARNRTFYPKLNVYGGSIRGPLGKGIANFEGAYYDSYEDRSGDNPFIRNSEVRLLAGYEQDLPMIAPELTLGLQYYVELMMDYDEYRDALPPGMHPADQDRHVITVRLTKMLMNQNLKLSMFGYYSPTDEDAYLRPNVSYKIDDHWTAEVGGNVFFGKHRYTFFGQFANDTNVYCALRYGF